MTASRDAHFTNKWQREINKSSRPANDQNGNKNLRLQVTSLQEQLDEQSQLSEIAAVFKEDNKPGTVANTNAEEKSLSMVRKVMKIVGREKNQTLHDYQLNLMLVDCLPSLRLHNMIP